MHIAESIWIILFLLLIGAYEKLLSPTLSNTSGGRKWKKNLRSMTAYWSCSDQKWFRFTLLQEEPTCLIRSKNKYDGCHFKLCNIAQRSWLGTESTPNETNTKTCLNFIIHLRPRQILVLIFTFKWDQFQDLSSF